ncbi:MAG: polysaccharide biosynthesis tyrosine autokinase [Chloroflexota bacterium]|nr:polysaccharide biosynthesis tyrosine autokinase [Chloroflexota bacterium]
MDVAIYLRFIRKWAWLVILAAFIAGGISFILNTGTPPTYQASVLMSIGSYIDSSNPELGDMMIAQQLVETYLTMLETREVLEATLDQLGLEGFPPEALAAIVSARTISDTSLFRINVVYTDPVLAADIANAISTQLIDKAPGLGASEQERLDSMRSELDQLEAMSSEFEDQQRDIETQLDNTTDPTERAVLQEQNNSLRVQIRETSTTMIGYTRSIDELELRSNRLQILEDARVPTSASSVNLISASLVGAVVGAIIALAAVIALEYLDDVVRTSEITVQTLGLPVLGAIMRIGKRTDTYNDRLVYNFPSMSPIAEGYRTLRTNLLFSSGNTSQGVYIITSPSPEEGKSMTTANLAITMALAGLQVLLIDADLRRPKLHEIFELENNVGLTTLLFADPSTAEALESDANDETKLPANLRQCLQNTSVPRLRVITSGFIPSNPTEILGSALMQRWIDAFRSSSNIDVVLIDSPPCLMVADATVLAATAKGDILLVLDASKTRRMAALKAKERFEQLGLDIKGIILNRLNPRDETYEYTYSYGYYYTPTGKGNPRGKNGAGNGRRDRDNALKESQTVPSADSDN